MKHKYIILILGLIGGFSTLQSQTIAKYAGEFLSFGVGGRALGMGGAYSALSGDATSGYWNPAGLAKITYPEIIAMHDERFGSLVSFDFAAIAIPYESDASLGLSVIRLGVDGIPDTRNAWIDNNGNGIFDNYDRLDYDKITYFNSVDWAFYFTYAKKSSSEFSYGANIKIIRRSLAEHSATGIGFDVGVTYTPVENLIFAATGQDITTTLVSWTTGRNELISPTLKLGSAYTFEILGGRLSPAFDADIRFENRQYASAAHLGPISFDPHFGLEFDYKQKVALRVGYNDIKQLTLGAGLHLRKIDIDYSFARFGNSENDLGNTHRISLRLILQEEKFERAKE